MGEWEIRPLKDGEADVVGAVLGLACLHSGNGLYMVARDGSEPVGHAHLALTDSPRSTSWPRTSPASCGPSRPPGHGGRGRCSVSAPRSKYAAKKARQAEEARLADLDPEPEEPQVQPEPTADGHKDGLGDVRALDRFNAEEMAIYSALLRDWRAETRQMNPGSKARRAMRASVLARTA
jgi:hypothetical protein